jgi:Zn-finger nucleic acid-binding protein
MSPTESTGVCPRDNTVLTQHEERGRMSLRCGQCAGLFVDRSSLLGRLPSGESGAGLKALPESAVACARCRVTMRMRVHRGTEVDVCPQCHSVWLDAGEWERIAKPGSTRGSHFGRTAVLAGAAAAVAGGAAASASAQQAASSPAAESLTSQIAGGVGDVALDGVVEVVFEFVGEALGSIF